MQDAPGSISRSSQGKCATETTAEWTSQGRAMHGRRASKQTQITRDIKYGSPGSSIANLALTEFDPFNFGLKNSHSFHNEWRFTGKESRFSTRAVLARPAQVAVHRSGIFIALDGTVLAETAGNATQNHVL
jgi:hypothetical protein